MATAGGKGANLGELIHAGLPVPDGFVVTTDAYAAVVDGLNLSGTSEPARDVVEAAAVPPLLRASIITAYAELGGGAVAVRSSATAEDLPGAAFAGQQDTYLNIVGEHALVDAVRRCWGSLWTDRAIAYRARLGIDSAQVRIAVVVQRMVAADAAGVLFTADPVSGRRDTVVVDASPGLGEAVVSGQVTPDHYELDASGRVREFMRGRREVVLRAAAGGGVAHAAGEETTGPSLTSENLVELTRLGRAVAAHFGRPQDIEWAVLGDRVQLVQARPMTALPPPPVRLNRVQRRLASVLLDYLPVRPYPIDMSTWVAHGPIDMMARIAARFGIRNVFGGALHEDEYGVVDRLLPQSPRPTVAALRSPFRLAALARRYDPGRWTADRRFTEFLAEVRELDAADLTSLPWRQLVAMPRQAMKLLAPIRELRVDYLPGTGVALLRLYLALRFLRRAALFQDVLLGANTRTADANRALEALAERARENPKLAAAVRTAEPDALATFPEFEVALAEYLAEYGHRETVSPVLVTTPTQHDAPDVVLGLISTLAASTPRPPVSHDPMAGLATHPLLRDRRRRARVERWIGAARAGIAFREDSHFYFLKPLPALRRSLLEIGARLHDADVLDRPEDVFHLRLEELEPLTDPTSATGDLRTKVRSRAARRDELTGVRLIDPAAVFPPTGAEGDALVSGTPAGSGTVTGPVRVIREPSQFGSLTTGDVLVCPYTNPAWTPLFARAAAVVVDSGGAASHAAIVAREYGIPAVMGTGSGTRVLSDGQQVVVNGSTGRVTAAPPG
ncbi:PEP-utilizing enzyme [Amycolatopsis sp. OK19-0408]|uniref:PEP-utilizing enzyme n=1 Tax=Amycolatopsis iheyensis TaxID=2945988 RepID=A0A9X2NMH1_9PSEU|nr:PEP/pyruvate-binding domain-containing protein [Amycolatopsis iheyensis]MCR6490662.1 PEP-utilizing enzyme [Amycolatopsis iheyensis]